MDGKLDWSYFDGEVHEAVRADHPLTQRMIAEIGLGSVDPDPDFPDEPDEWGLHVPDIRDVYRLMGEHYGLTTRSAIEVGACLPGGSAGG